MIELIIFGLTPEVKPSPLIQTVIKTQVQTETIEEPTLEEKIKNNYYKCDETRQYIRADNATCLDRPQYRASTSRSSTSSTNTSVATKNTNTAPTGWYPTNSCTHYVWTKRQVGLWNDGSLWYSQAKRDGWETGTTPQVGAIGVAKTGNHVVYIELVQDNKVYLSERNYDYRGSYRERWASADDFNYIY